MLFDGATNFPDLKLTVGTNYFFHIDTLGHNFTINVRNADGSKSLLVAAQEVLSANSVDHGTIAFNPNDGLDGMNLFYSFQVLPLIGRFHLRIS